MSWFGAPCDDDYEQAGVPDLALASSWDHRRSIVVAADRNGFDAVPLPSGYALGIDATALAAAVAPLTERIRLLLVRCIGELVVPQLARQIATLQQILGDRLLVNIISSDVPGESLAGAPLPAHAHGDADLRRAAGRRGRSGARRGPRRFAHRRRRTGVPALYFGACRPRLGTWRRRRPTFTSCGPTPFRRWRRSSTTCGPGGAHGRTLRFGYRVHVIVRESEAEARAAARHLVAASTTTRARPSGTGRSTRSAGVARQGELRHAADDEGCMWRRLDRIGLAGSSPGRRSRATPSTGRAVSTAAARASRGRRPPLISRLPPWRATGWRLVPDGYLHAPLGA
ncbi:MAG: LLM class flavin-dependent oxidoreductase [Acidimicrobiales bacterium]